MDLRRFQCDRTACAELPLTAFVLVVAMCAGVSLVPAQNQSNPGAETKSQACPNDDSGLKLPDGFCATVFADGIGHARHVAVAPNGVVYTNTWSGEYYNNTPVHAGNLSWRCRTSPAREKLM